MNELLDRLAKEFEDDADGRYAYVDALSNALVSAQIKALREDRKLSQEELADRIGTKQSGYRAWNDRTIQLGR